MAGDRDDEGGDGRHHAAVGGVVHGRDDVLQQEVGHEDVPLSKCLPNRSLRHPVAVEAAISEEEQFSPERGISACTYIVLNIKYNKYSKYYKVTT